MKALTASEIFVTWVKDRESRNVTALICLDLNILQLVRRSHDL
jgi:hypothetical protein